MRAFSIAFFIVSVATICRSDSVPWCQRPLVRIGQPGAPSLQDLRYGSHIYAGFLLSSAHHYGHTKTMVFVRDVAERIKKYGITSVIIDEEGTEEEKMLIGKYGEGPLPRLVLWDRMPQQWLSRPRLISTTFENAEDLAHRVEHAIAEEGFDRDVEPSCPKRRVKDGIVHVTEDANEL